MRSDRINQAPILLTALLVLVAAPLSAQQAPGADSDHIRAAWAAVNADTIRLPGGLRLRGACRTPELVQRAESAIRHWETFMMTTSGDMWIVQSAPLLSHTQMLEVRGFHHEVTPSRQPMCEYSTTLLIQELEMRGTNVGVHRPTRVQCDPVLKARCRVLEEESMDEGKPGLPSGAEPEVSVVDSPSAASVDFPFPGYADNVVRQIELNWTSFNTPRSPADVSFLIRRDGSVDSVRIVASSGDSVFDAEARDAILRASRAFDPLPAAFTAGTLPLTFRFAPATSH